jgi:hypothetical protein
MIAKLCALDDPALAEIIATKRTDLLRLAEAKECILAETRASKPLHLQCRRAAQTRDTLVRRHLGLLADAQALESLAAVRRAAAAEGAVQCRAAETELQRLTEMYQHEMQLQSVAGSAAPAAPAGAVPTLDDALAMLRACGLKAVPLGMAEAHSMTVDDSDEEKIAKLVAGASPEAELAEAEEISRRSAEAAFRPIRGTSVARDDPYGASRHSAAGTPAGVGDGTFREPAEH